MRENRKIVLASRPAAAVGEIGHPERGVREEHFRLVEAPLEPLADGQVLVRNHWLSLDPYMRGRMDAAPGYAPRVELGQVMVGGTVGEVVESRHRRLKPGDWVVGALGWQLYGVAAAGEGLAKIDLALAAASCHLGVLGMPGVTAWLGLLEVAAAKAGETVVVSGASGAVGGVAGQIAKIKGCRAVGIAGGREKCAYVVDELGFDACVDYKEGRLEGALGAAAPGGVDVCFENAGGAALDAALARMNPFGRVALCGLRSQFDAAEPYPYRHLRSLLLNRVRLQGFIVSDRMELWPRARAELSRWLGEGKLKYKECVVRGLENAPKAFIDMLAGRHFGKPLVKLTA